MSKTKSKKKKYRGKRQSLEAKRRKIAEQKKAKKNSTLIFLGAGILIILALVIGFSISQKRQTNTAGTQIGTNQDYSQAEKIEMSDVKNSNLIGFTYNDGSQTKPLLAYISPQGKLVTAISICEPCKSTRFHIEGDILVCNTCATRWNLNTLAGISGGCIDYPPDEITNSVEGDNIYIEENLVKDWNPRA